MTVAFRPNLPTFLKAKTMEFQVLSHAGLRIKGAGLELVFDPWLVGSTYWRSWWNFPPVPAGLTDTLKPDFIYLTHIHWDHFQGPSLRLFPKETRILIPRDHNPRLKVDLVKMGYRNVTELRHGESIDLAPGFRVTSWHFYPFTDSAAVVECEGTVLFNTNDAKFMGRPLDQIRRRHPRIDFVFRSHSSANPRVCFDFTDAPNQARQDNGDYLRDFAAFAQSTGTRYAIPFASNHCFLHKEVFRFNNTVTTPSQVEAYFRKHGIVDPEIKVMVAGDSWSSRDGFKQSAVDWFSDRDARLLKYAQAKGPVLEKFYALEARADVTLPQVEKYFQRFRATLAWPIRRLFKGRPIGYALTGKQLRFFVVDLYRGTVQEAQGLDDAAHPLQIRTSSHIFKQCMALDLFLYLGISKRVVFRCRQADAKYLWLLEFCFNLYECHMLPLRRMLRPRFVAAWIPRWREALLYATILVRKAMGKGFSVSDYLPPPKGRGPGPGAGAPDAGVQRDSRSSNSLANSP